MVVSEGSIEIKPIEKEVLGEEEQNDLAFGKHMEDVCGKKRKSGSGRKIDPNSLRQRCLRYVRENIGPHRTKHIAEALYESEIRVYRILYSLKRSGLVHRDDNDEWVIP